MATGRGVLRDLILKLFNGGFEINRIARHLNVNRATIYYHLDKNNIKTRGIANSNKIRRIIKDRRIKRAS
jgi:predicted transcriptional regulator